MSNLTVKFVSNSQSHAAYSDCMIESVCREYLTQLKNGEEHLQITTNQELVIYMFRALLCREYRIYQASVVFTIDDREVIFDSNMRNASGIYPPSVFEKCCDVLIGASYTYSRE